MIAANFARSMPRILVHEGGYSNHPKDSGGVTLEGVIQRVYDGYRDNKDFLSSL
jgi:lysozyme family protein